MLFFCLVCEKLFSFLPQFTQNAKAFPVLAQVKIRIAVQRCKVIPFIQQLNPLILAMNLQKQIAQFTHLSNTDRKSVNPAAALSVRSNPALQNNHILIRIHVVRKKPFSYGCGVKFCSNNSPFRPCPYKFTTDTRSGCCGNRVNNNAFAGSGFTGQYIKPMFKADICARNNRNIFNSQFMQHSYSLSGFKTDF